MFSFVKNRVTFYVVSLALFVFSLVSPWIFGLNEGIDMTGGIQIEYQVTNGDVEAMMTQTRNELIDGVRATLDPVQQNIITDTLVYRVTGTDNFVIEAGINESQSRNAQGDVDLEQVDAAKTAFVDGLRSAYTKQSDAVVTQTRYVNIGASFGAYIKNSGYITIAISIIAISIYIMYAFWGSIPGVSSGAFAFVTSISLLHDVVVAFGLYVVTSFFFPEFKIDTFFITAMLTVLGYSINDSIVIMDRIRSNLHEGKSKKFEFARIIDNSIHGTMRRSIFTSLTVVFVLIAMFFFGPESIRGFTLALIFGTIVGTYSSICLAAPLLIDVTSKKKQ